ncbi:MAG: MutS-related protein, partial [Anaerolineae bacterium]
AVFAHLERFSYAGKPHLRALCAPFLDPEQRPSHYLAGLNRLVAAMGLRQNPVLGLVLNLLLPWDAFLTYRLGRTWAAVSDRAPGWLDAWFELEALGSLAGFAYLNPGYAFPQIDRGEGSPVLEATALGHPLLPEAQKVSNDFTIPHLGWVAIITGSNMAGKSVFLKTVGANLALAFAGGPASARALRTWPLRLFASMEVSDSVTDGISYFYAEVKRLKALLAALEGDDSLPLLFFIDEIFRGTNNRERLLGSRAYVRALVGRRGAGLIATHDLELAKLAGEVREGGQYRSAVENYHFRDRVVDGRMVFDYVLHPGPCPTTNALKIMALEGLPVPDEASIQSSREPPGDPQGSSARPGRGLVE